MLLVSRSGLVEEGAVEVFHYYDFHLPSFFRENNNVVIFPFLIFCYIFNTLIFRINLAMLAKFAIDYGLKAT